VCPTECYFCNTKDRAVWQPSLHTADRHSITYDEARDSNASITVRRVGFTVNQVGSYTTADALIDEALRLAAIYSRIVAPVAVTRIAMRYINARLRTEVDASRNQRFLLDGGVQIPC
jgi:uncharacterized protein (TIGR04255 family)